MAWWAALGKAAGALGGASGGGAAAGGGAAGGGAAAGGAKGGGMMSKMMGGKGGGGGGGGGGMMSGIADRANMPKQAIIGLGSGLIQSIQAQSLKKKADAATPGLVDPRQASFLAELNQKRKSIDTGADFAAGMQAINTTNAGTNNALVAAAGGDAGGTIQALLQSERASNDSKNNVLAQGQGQQMQYNSMFNDLNNKIAARSLQLQMQRSQQARAEWAAKQQSASQNLMAGVAGLAEQKQQYGKPITSAPVTSGGDAISQIPALTNTMMDWNAAKTPPVSPAQVTPTVMQGKAEMPPITSGNNMLGAGMGSILSLKK